MRKIPSRSLTLILTIGALAAPMGCNNNAPPPGAQYQPQLMPPVRPQIQPQANVQSQSFLMDSTAFDLETIIGMVRGQQFKNAAELEAIINNGTSGLNNVDLDHDNQIDYVGIKETSFRGGFTFDFVAVPSSQQGEPVTIASINFLYDKVMNQVTVQGAYPSYVSGYDQYYYNYYVPRGPSFSQMLFLSWMFSHRPAYMYTPYGYGYSRRAIMAPQVMATTRTTTRTQMHVSPVPKQAQPSGYSIQSAEPTRSRLASPSAPTGSGLSGRSETMRNFEQRDTAKAKPQGTGFGAPPAPGVKAPPTAPANPAWKTQRTAPTPTTPSGKAQPPTASPPPSWKSPPTSPAPTPTFKAQPPRASSPSPVSRPPSSSGKRR